MMCLWCFIFNLTSTSHPKDKSFWCHVWMCMSLMGLVSRRLFDHPYPSPPGASHLPHTSHQTQGRATHKLPPAHNFVTRSCFLPHLLWNTTRPPSTLNPPACPFSPTFHHLCSPAPALSFLCPSQIHPGSGWWMGHYSCPLLAWFNCHNPSPPSLCLSCLSVLWGVCLSHTVGIEGLKTYGI